MSSRRSQRQSNENARLGFPTRNPRLLAAYHPRPHPSRERIDNLARAAAAFASYDFGTMLVHEFHLFQSTLRPTGAEYAWLRNFCFVQDAE